MPDFSIDDVVATIKARCDAPATQSYTRSLLEGGTARVARKFGEESVELVVALMQDDRPAVVAEAADVMFHLLVALQSQGVPFDDVLAELQRRTAQSGIDEKNSRKAGR